MKNISKLKIFCVFILSLFLCTTTVKSETLIVPVQDILFFIPNFENAPDFNLNASLNGSQFISDVVKDKKRNRKRAEQQMIGMLWEIYPDATSIILFRGNFIIKLP